jgi:hypothetical protein
VDYSLHDPIALAAFLELPVKAVFPMYYDISDVAVGHPESVRRNIFEEPPTRLSQKELVDMAVESTRRL